MPKWNLNIVLKALRAAPFEPVDKIEIKYLSLKTAFLVMWGTASRISEMHALCMDDDHLQWGQNGDWVDLTAGMKFLAKNRGINQLARKFRLKALEQNNIVGDYHLICPVCALRAYLDKTKAERGEQTNR